MYKKGAGNDKQGKDVGNRTLCPYRNFSQAIMSEEYRRTSGGKTTEAIQVEYWSLYPRQTSIIYECFLMCYFMHFDPISSRILGVFQPDLGQV